MRCKQNTVNMEEEFFYEDLNVVPDARLARRLHRRLVVKKNFKKQNLMVNTAKRTLDLFQKGEGLADPSYARYINAYESSEDHTADDAEDNDPQYAMCLKHLREDEKSYVLEMTMNDLMHLLIKYEEENELGDDLLHKSSKDVFSGDMVEMEQVCRDITCEENMTTPLTLGSPSNKGRKISVVEKNAKAECRENDRLSPKHDLMDCYNPESKHDMVYDMGNESYDCFLSCLSTVGKTMVLVTEDGKHIRYEENTDSSSESDSEVVVIGYFNKASGRVGSKFREKLMDILSMPFDKLQYEALKIEASRRKPINGYRRLRNVEKTYATKKSGESYLDCYPDLARKIYSVRYNHPRVLNLLRGFFYWLQNLSQEGAFRPWLDESCLKLM